MAHDRRHSWLPRQVPPRLQPVAAITAIQVVLHLSVEVAVEPVGLRPQLHQVEPGVASLERVEGPPGQGDPGVEGPRPLGQLERVPHARPASVRQHGQHVRVQVDAVPLRSQESERESHHPFLYHRPDRRVPARLERPKELRGHGAVFPPRGPDDVVDAIAVGELHQDPDLHPGPAGRVMRELPRLRMHGASLLG